MSGLRDRASLLPGAAPRASCSQTAAASARVKGMSEMSAMSATHAERLLQGQPLIKATSGSIPEMKALRDRCLAAGIPALVGPPPCGGKSCSTKAPLLIQESSIPALSEILHGEWNAHLEREGLPAIRLDFSDTAGDEPPCPACGTAAPLVNGACSDCGLRLE